MVKICEVCGLKQSPGCDKTFHRIPSNVVVAETWCNALMINRNNLKRKFPVICSSHFLPHHVIHLGSRTVLSKNAIPTCELNIIDIHDQSTSTPVCDHEKPDVSISFEVGEMGQNIDDTDAKEQSFSTTLTASEFEDDEIVSSSTLTAPEALKYEEGTQQGLDSTNAGRQSFSTTLTDSEVDDKTSSSTSTAPEALTEIQKSLENEPFRRRLKTSTSATSELELENIPPNVPSYGSASSEEKCKDDDESTDTQETFSTPTVRSPKIISNPRKRKTNWRSEGSVLKKKSIRYFGDLDSDDMEDAKNRRKFFQIARNTISKQRAKIRQLQQTKRRMSQKIQTLKSLTQHLRNHNMISENAECTLNASLSGASRELFNRMLKRPGTQKYSPELRQFALTLNFYSTKSYNYVRQTFFKSLPHVRTLSKWYQTVDCTPGFLKEALNALKVKAGEASSKGIKILCNLVFDEMAIRKRVEWDGKKFHGYVDFGVNLESDNLDEAKEALVFMLVALNGSWKIPLGYFFVNGLAGSEKANLLRNCLKFINESGVIVTSITFDGTPTNFTVVKMLGASLNPSNLKPYFIHPDTNEKVYVFPDPSHMIKLVRNAFGSKQVLNVRRIEKRKLIYGKPIKWDFIKKLSEVQETDGLHLATKLRKRHIAWVKEKMKVKLAVQTLSNSVAVALDYLNLDLKLEEFSFSEPTSFFCRTFNNLFDIFNSRSRFTKKPYEKPLSPQTKTEYFDYMNHCSNYIQKLTIGNENIPALYSKRKTGFLGFLICIESLKQLYEERVIEKKQLKYVLTYKLSQDHLEIFFSCVRAKGGYNNNPTARQFSSIMKRILVHSEIKGSNCANAVALDSTNILHCTSSLLVRNEEDSVEDKIRNWKKTEDHDYIASNVWDLTLYVDDVVAYIAGFVVKKIKKIIKCSHCLNLLEYSEAISSLQKRKTYGIMVKASQFVVNVCKEGEKSLRLLKNSSTIFSGKLGNLKMKLIIETFQNLKGDIFYVFSDHFFDDEPLSNHGFQLSKLILEKYFDLRIHHETSILENNRESRIRSVLTKTILFKNQ